MLEGSKKNLSICLAIPSCFEGNGAVVKSKNLVEKAFGRHCKCFDTFPKQIYECRKFYTQFPFFYFIVRNQGSIKVFYLIQKKNTEL